MAKEANPVLDTRGNRHVARESGQSEVLYVLVAERLHRHVVLSRDFVILRKISSPERLLLKVVYVREDPATLVRVA